ncbi:hypothetical protein NW762_007181 [Fusarium torreyae]|uniref:Choline monooxygenase, chloroplastic n=1 Tax=Fusarium torreyae TaxID=1237075 RepID=A0A9W8VDU3_9HYPO|nr:hypothetical protein NW762_007181 [Fusarium torreyae]
MENKDIAVTLPASWYTSKAIGTLEKRAVFFKSWILLGAVTKYPKKGVDYKNELCQVDFTVRRSEDDWNSLKVFRDSDGSELRSYLTKTGLLFFTLSDQTVSFQEFFPGLEALVDTADFTKLGLRRPLKYHSNNNWKATVDAYQECLHCAYAHPEFAKEFKPSVYKVIEHHNYSQHIAGTTSGDAPGLFLYLLPNCTLSLYAGGLTCWRTSPTEEPGKARMEFGYYHEQPEGSTVFEEWYRFTRNVALEDIELCEKSQANLNVGIYSSGLLNPEKENGVISFHNRIFELCNEQYEKESGELVGAAA